MRFSPRTKATIVAGASTLALAVGFLAVSATPAAAAAAGCGKAGYAYAGYQNANRAHGVRATLRALSTPAVESGHVAAWVGLGGPGLGPNGTDAWLQIGLSAFSWERGTRLYYEVNRPGVGPRYHEIVARVAPGKRHRVAVLETRKRDWWRVWVDGKPVSPPLHIRGSSGRWHPIATAETWDGGRRACNRFEYGFENVAVARRRGGSWSRFVGGHRFLDTGFRVQSARRGTFLARTVLRPPRVVTQTSAPPAAPAAPVASPAPAPATPPEAPPVSVAVEAVPQDAQPSAAERLPE